MYYLPIIEYLDEILGRWSSSIINLLMMIITSSREVTY